MGIQASYESGEKSALLYGKRYSIYKEIYDTLKDINKKRLKFCATLKNLYSVVEIDKL